MGSRSLFLYFFIHLLYRGAGDGASVVQKAHWAVSYQGFSTNAQVRLTLWNTPLPPFSVCSSTKLKFDLKLVLLVLAFRGLVTPRSKGLTPDCETMLVALASSLLLGNWSFLSELVGWFFLPEKGFVFHDDFARPMSLCPLILEHEEDRTLIIFGGNEF